MPERAQGRCFGNPHPQSLTGTGKCGGMCQCLGGACGRPRAERGPRSRGRQGAALTRAARTRLVQDDVLYGMAGHWAQRDKGEFVVSSPLELLQDVITQGELDELMESLTLTRSARDEEEVVLWLCRGREEGRGGVCHAPLPSPRPPARRPK